MSFTPGPWFPAPDNCKAIDGMILMPITTSEFDGAPLALVPVRRVEEANCWSEALEDALLISAAPRLLEELKSAVEAMKLWHLDYQPYDENGCVICLDLPRLEAAIAEAQAS